MSSTSEALLSDSEPIPFRPRAVATTTQTARGSTSTSLRPVSTAPVTPQVCFNRLELSEILTVYGRMVAAGEWRDYAIDFGREKAVFSVFRRTTEYPLFRIEKNPKFARKQGAYSVVAANGMILKRGTELQRVLAVIDTKLKPVS